VSRHRWAAPYLDDGDVLLYAGDCVEVMRGLPEASVDAVVTDPPYGLEFMGKEWDRFDRRGPSSFENLGVQDERGRRSRDPNGTSTRYLDKPRWSTMGPSAARAFGAWCETWATEALRVLKPGGYLLAFGGTRTYHRLACAIEDAGFEVRDCLVWLYGSGFPKSLDVSKAIDKAAGAEREVVGEYAVTRDFRDISGGRYGDKSVDSSAATVNITAPATPEAAAWQGWGTALKPGHEPIILARKPLAERTVAAQVLATGTGAINVDGCRIGNGGHLKWSEPRDMGYHGGTDAGPVAATENPAGRWPANVVLDEQAAALLDAEVGERPTGGLKPYTTASVGYEGGWGRERDVRKDADTGGPSRFFYTAKAGADEREGSKHPTVKPLALMRWLVRLVTPPGGVVLDPFAGSGTTLRAAREEGFRAIGIEREAEYLRDAAHRLRQLSLFAEGF
jgi:DNA modification methylase